MSPLPRTRLAPALAALIAVIAVIALAGCGGSSSSQSTTGTTTGASVTPSPSATGADGSTTKTDASDTSTIGPTHVQKPLRGTGGQEINDDNPGRADTGNGSAAQNAENPCRLVSRAQAEAILHQSLATPQYAPLGPTCIYKHTGSKTYVTIALEPLTLSRLAPLIHKRSHVTVSGHSGYCGIYGQQSLFVGLKGGKVLAVVAPCNTAKQLAAVALTKLKS